MKHILRLGLVSLTMVLGASLLTNHSGFAIRIASYFFVFLLAGVIWRLHKYE